MRVDYEYCIPSLISEQAVCRLRGELDMRTGLVVSHYDLAARIVRLTGIPDRDRQLRALLTELGFAPDPEHPPTTSLERPVAIRRPASVRCAVAERQTANTSAPSAKQTARRKRAAQRPISWTRWLAAMS